MPKARLKDITLYYEVYGKGTPLLLIAGLGSDHSSWLGVARAFSKNFQIIIFDNRGSGRSDIPAKKYSVRQMADDAIQLLDYLKIKKCHVLGHSMGGYIAQELAIHYPERVDKLILEGTASVSSKRNNILFNDFLIELKKNADLKLWLSQWTFWLFSPKTFDKKTFVPLFIKNALQYPYGQPVAGFKQQIGAIASFNAVGRIKTIGAKTLVIAGEEDQLITPEESRVLATSIRHSLFVTIKNAAHAIHLENPKAFIKAVGDFLSHFLSGYPGRPTMRIKIILFHIALLSVYSICGCSHTLRETKGDASNPVDQGSKTELQLRGPTAIIKHSF